MASSSDPANVGYIIQENGFWYVAYKEKVKVPEVVVSAKGVVNGLSEEYNDGWDFGPDSYDPNSTASIPYTQTTGIQEATDYMLSSGSLQNGLYYLSNLFIRNGRYTINATILISPTVPIANLTITGETQIGVQLYAGSNLSGYVFEIDTTSANVNNIDGVNIEIDNITNFTAVPFLSAQYYGTAMKFKNILQSFNVGCSSTSGLANFVASGLIAIILENCNTYFGGTYGTLYSLNNNYVYVNGPQLGAGIYVSGSDVLDIPTFSVNGGGGTSPIPTLYLAEGNYVVNIGNMAVMTQINVGANSQCRILRIGTLSLDTGVSTLIINSTTTSGVINTIDIGDILIIASSGAFALAGSYVNIGGLKYKSLYSQGGMLSGYYIPPTLSDNPPVSGTVYQNTNTYDIEIDLPVYATTSGTAGYVTVAKGATDTPTAIANQFVNGSTSSSSVDIIRLRVPAGWYYEFTASGVTFGTASVFAE